MPTMAPPEDALKERFARLDERFDRTDERIADVDRRVAEAAKDTSRRFEEVNRRITEGKEESNHRFDRVEGDMRDLKKSVESIQTTLTRVSIGVALTFASVLLTKGI